MQAAQGAAACAGGRRDPQRIAPPFYTVGSPHARGLVRGLVRQRPPRTANVPATPIPRGGASSHGWICWQCQHRAPWGAVAASDVLPQMRGYTELLRLHCRDHTLEQVSFLGTNAGVVVGPGRHDHDEVEGGHEKQALPAVSDRRTPGQFFSLPVNVAGPPAVAISGASAGARCNMWADGFCHPFRWNDLATLPAALVEHHLADLEEVARFEAQTRIGHRPAP